MINQTKILKFTHPIKSELIFVNSAIAFSCALIWILTAIFSADNPKKPIPTPMFMLITCSVLCVIMSIMVVWHQTQQVEIDAENHSVRYANSRTHHGWEMFGLDDVIAIRAVLGLKSRLGISIRLKPSPGREWDYIYLDNLDGPPKPDPMDSALFLTLVQQIRYVHPEMKITGMPQNYRGSLPKEICVFDGRW